MTTVSSGHALHQQGFSPRCQWAWLQPRRVWSFFVGIQNNFKRFQWVCGQTRVKLALSNPDQRSFSEHFPALHQDELCSKKMREANRSNQNNPTNPAHETALPHTWKLIVRAWKTKELAPVHTITCWFFVDAWRFQIQVFTILTTRPVDQRKTNLEREGERIK